MAMKDELVTVTLHRADFNPENWEAFKSNTFWYHVSFVGQHIINVITWESNYSKIQRLYNFVC